MTATFDAGLSTDKDKVRFEVGDTGGEGYYLQDETIDALLVLEGTVGRTSVACCEYIITQLARPDFKLDWLKIENRRALEGFERILIRIKQKFGLSRTSPSTGSVTAVKPYRQDSEQTDGDYTLDDDGL